LQQHVKELEMKNTLLSQRVYELQGELRGVQMAYDLLTGRLPSGGFQIDHPPENTASPRTALPSTPEEAMLAAVRNHPIIVTLDWKDYPHVRFWQPNDFNNWVKEELKGLPLDSEAKFMYRFLENKDGECIEERRHLMLEVLYAAWYELLHAPGLLPSTWGKASYNVRVYVWATLEAAFPELRLCAVHWKAQKLATLNYSWWHTKNVKAQKQNIKNEQGDGSSVD
ncbi:hypothetical protein HDZ31DRAFT_14500, partial [Schizophyllum fasciatum]